MGISINGPSGIDTQYIIDSLVELEKQKVTKVENEKKAYQVKIDAYSKFRSLLSDIKSKASALSKTSSFDIFTNKSSNEKAVTITGGTGGVDAQYDVKVFQLASSEKMISTDGRVTSQDATLASLGISTGDITVDGVTINIDDDDTIQDLRLKINNATDEDGNKIGVSASVLKVSDSNFRLVLSGKDSGSAGVEYSGLALQDLGILNADGSKGNTNQKIVSSVDVRSAFNDAAFVVGESITINGTDHDGRAISGTIVKKAGDDQEDFLNEVEKIYNGMVDASFDEVTGNLVITDKVAGTSRLSLNSMAFEGQASIALSTDTVGDEGTGVLSVGKDAYFSVENVLMSSSKNSASGFVTGATFELNGVSPSESVKVELKRDVDGIKKKFQELVDAYNALLRFSKESTKHANPDDENSSDGSLAGDSTTSSIVSQFRSFFQQNSPSEGTYTNFTLIGLKTNTSTGEYSIDDEMFKKALNTGFDEVVKLFTTTGVSDNSSIVMGRNTPETKSGKYTIEEVDGQHFRIQLQGSSEWYVSDARVGDIITFSDGPAKGLSLTAPAGSIGAGGSAVFTFSRGLSSTIENNVDKLTDTTEGTVALRQESWRRTMKQADDRILKLEERIEKYRLRLVKQFTAMEQAISQMKSQGSQLSASSFLYSDS